MENKLDVLEKADRQQDHKFNEKINWLEGQLGLANKEIKDMKQIDDRYENIA